MLVILLGYGLIEVPRHLLYFDLFSREARSVLTLLRNENILREHAQTIVAKFPPELVSQITSTSMGSFPAASSITPGNEGLVANVNYLVCIWSIFLFTLLTEINFNMLKLITEYTSHFLAIRFLFCIDYA
ncbi:unnamed protein product [Gongylonema pulchrum]|uniref:Uncharacterized protein n=1 Tax=Gongylonema pulchrum TaxID=637853 RepID=A0A183DBJ1_9BILA|nr:unnamed protein product [Gongylonema pulchrum]